jgi:hypothetical protein
MGEFNEPLSRCFILADEERHECDGFLKENSEEFFRGLERARRALKSMGLGANSKWNIS